jgi:hypothetical protein
MWTSLGIFNVINDWSYTPTVEGELFRITHTSIPPIGNEYLKGAIGQSFIDEDGKQNIFDSQLLTYQLFKDVRTFYFPIGVANHSIAFKRLDDSAVHWVIKIEVWSSPDNGQNLSNYLAGRFGAQTLMALYSNPVSAISLLRDSLTITSADVAITSNVVVQLAGSNANRAFLSIYNPIGKDLSISLSASGTSPNLVLGTVIALAKANTIFELPVVPSGATYTGAVYGKVSGSNGTIAVTEYAYP